MTFRKPHLIALTLVLSFAMVGGALAQNTIYVNQAVASSGDGLTPGTAKKTVAEGLAVANVTGNLIDPTTTDLWTLFDAAVAWADNVTLPVPGGQAALIVADDVIVDGIANTSRPDGLIHDRLVSLGYTVQVVSESDVANAVFTSLTAVAKDLVFISESVGSGNMDNLRGANVPVISTEPAMYDNWFWSATGGTSVQGTQVAITNPAHALAGGFTGNVTIYSETKPIAYIGITEDGLAPSAQVVATVVGNADRVTIFALDTGAALLNATTAPARRVGFLIWGAPGFLRRDFPTDLNVAVAQGVYQETSTLLVGGYRVEGGWNPTFTARDPATMVTTLDGLGNKRIMEVNATSNFTVDGFSFIDANPSFTGTNDQRGGALLVNSSTSGVVTNCVFDNNTMSGTGDEFFGAGMAVNACTEVIVSNCTFTNNRVSGTSDDSEGGAMRLDDCVNCSVIDCTFTDNQVADVAAVFDQVKAGALAADDNTNTLISGCTFTRNHSQEDIGALYFNDGSGIIENCVFTENTCRDDRAVMEVDSADVTVRNCSFIANTAGDDQIVQVENTYNFSGDTATPPDPSDTATMHTVIFDGCLFQDNVVVGLDASGDTLFGMNDNCGASTNLFAIVNSVFVGNSVVDDRLLQIKGLNILVANNVFFANTLGDMEVVGWQNNDNDDDMGYITNPYVPPTQTDFDNRTGRLINNIFVDNVVGNGDFVIEGRDHTANPDPDNFRFIWTQVTNNIFQNNTRVDGTQLDGTAEVVGTLDGGGGVTPDFPITLDGRLTGNGNFLADPLFVGAPTDFHLQAASQAIDAGQSLTEVPTDFDGVPRPAGPVHDIGAFEWITVPVGPTNLTAASFGSDAILLNWDDNSDMEAGYKIERHDDGANPTFAEIDQTGTNVAQYIDIGLDDATTYTYRVRAFNNAGDSPYSNEASASPSGGLDATRWILYR